MWQYEGGLVVVGIGGQEAAQSHRGEDDVTQPQASPMGVGREGGTAHSQPHPSPGPNTATGGRGYGPAPASCVEFGNLAQGREAILIATVHPPPNFPLFGSLAGQMRWVREPYSTWGPEVEHPWPRPIHKTPSEC